MSEHGLQFEDKVLCIPHQHLKGSSLYKYTQLGSDVAKLNISSVG